MKKTISSVIAIAVVGLLVYFFVAHNLMMTTFIARNDARMVTVMNTATKRVSEYKFYDITYKEEDCVDGKSTVFMSTHIQIEVGENGAYTLYAEKTIGDGEDSVKQKIYFKNNANETGTIYVDSGMKCKSDAKTINEAIQIATCISETPNVAAARFNNLAEMITVAEVTEETIKDYQATLMFLFSPFKVGVSYAKTTPINEETGEELKHEYRVAFGGNLSDIIETLGTEKNNYKKTTTFNGSGNKIDIPAMEPETIPDYILSF